MMLAFGPSFYPKSGGDDANDARFPAAACNLKTSGADVHGARLAAARCNHTRRNASKFWVACLLKVRNVSLGWGPEMASKRKSS